MKIKTHTSCQKCGSSDARYVYSAIRSFCFSCRSLFVQGSPYSGAEVDRPLQSLRLPEDSETPYRGKGYDWIKQYEITSEELLRHNVKWSESKQQLIYPWYNEDNTLIGFQARNFFPEAKSKYFTQGDISSLLPIYTRNNPDNNLLVSSNSIVLVEDCVSAIKIARYCDCMPCLGSDINLTKLTRLRRFYDVLGVWLDYNMYKNAMRIQERASLIGFKAHVISTNLDPKEYDDDTIKCALKGLS